MCLSDHRIPPLDRVQTFHIMIPRWITCNPIGLPFCTVRAASQAACPPCCQIPGAESCLPDLFFFVSQKSTLYSCSLSDRVLSSFITPAEQPSPLPELFLAACPVADPGVRPGRVFFETGLFSHCADGRNITQTPARQPVSGLPSSFPPLLTPSIF